MSGRRGIADTAKRLAALLLAAGAALLCACTGGTEPADTPAETEAPEVEYAMTHVIRYWPEDADYDTCDYACVAEIPRFSKTFTGGYGMNKAVDAYIAGLEERIERSYMPASIAQPPTTEIACAVDTVDGITNVVFTEKHAYEAQPYYETYVLMLDARGNEVNLCDHFLNYHADRLIAERIAASIAGDERFLPADADRVQTFLDVNHGARTQKGGCTVYVHEGLLADHSFGEISFDLTFDEVTSTKVLNTNYMVWMTDYNYFGDDFNKKVIPICYLSTSGTGNSASTTTIWERTKSYEQSFETDIEAGNDLPDVSDHWAVVISPSTTWGNYRHQADAFAMYQTLRQHGYDDEHIVLIVEDNLADSPNNKDYPGQIFVERSDDAIIHDDLVNLDVRKGAKVDYHFSALTREDVADIMLGRQSDRLPEVIHPTANSDVFFFWSGHGGSAQGPLWGNEDANTYFGTERISSIVSEMNEAGMYRRMMFAIETCFSGKWGEALTGQPNVLVLTAANPRETSKADVHDRELGVYLSNAYARTFRKYVNQNNQITLRDLYIELAKTTNGSHVSIYNERNYGSVYTNTMADYFPR